tara:strand:- start:91186 stop:91947 length:762 start_codon:yes stop_codon:yes gene_type:complete
MRPFYLFLICVLSACGGKQSLESKAPMQASISQRPKVLFLDVNETLLDLGAMRASVANALGGREDLLPLWFSTMLHHSLVDSAINDYHSFGEVGVAALQMVAEANNIPLTHAAAKEAIVTPLRSLPPHPDVVEGLTLLKKKGYTIVSLTNSSDKGVQTQFENAGLLSFFDRRLSVDSVKKFKPNMAVYEWALAEMGIEASEGLMIAAHGWDIAGAKAAGMQAAFISRPGKVMYPLSIPADYVAPTLLALAEEL